MNGRHLSYITKLKKKTLPRPWIPSLSLPLHHQWASEIISIPETLIYLFYFYFIFVDFVL
jgi:hypothetical protein